MQDEKPKKELVERPNKEQLKRVTQVLKTLILQLIELPVRKLEGLSLSDAMLTGVLAAKNMERTALKRQIKYMVGLMRDVDANVEVVERELYLLAQPHMAEVQGFHEVEQWRDGLIAGDDGLINTLIDRFPAIDRQSFRQLVRNARKETAMDKTPKSARLLFRYLMEMQSDD